MLIAIGLDYAVAQGPLIFSLSIMNNIDEVNRAFEVLHKSIEFLRNMSPLYRQKRK